MKIKTHNDLEVYRLAFESAVKIFEISKGFPVEEKYSLTDQIRRSSRSVCANLAESFRKRKYPKHFISKLSDSQSEAAEKARFYLNEVGLSHRLKHRPGELSGGEQQRVAIARALVMEPEFILADEPTGNLDRKTAQDVEDLMLELNAKNKISFILATHNEHLAARLTRKLRLTNGVFQES